MLLIQTNLSSSFSPFQKIGCDMETILQPWGKRQPVLESSTLAVSQQQANPENKNDQVGQGLYTGSPATCSCQCWRTAPSTSWTATAMLYQSTKLSWRPALSAWPATTGIKHWRWSTVHMEEPHLGKDMGKSLLTATWKRKPVQSASSTGVRLLLGNMVWMVLSYCTVPSHLQAGKWNGKPCIFWKKLNRTRGHKPRTSNCVSQNQLCQAQF